MSSPIKALDEQLVAVFRDIDVLMMPTDSSIGGEESPSDWLDKLLEQKVSADRCNVQPMSSDIRWRYVQACLDALERLKCVLKQLAKLPCNSGLAPDALSVAQQQKVSALLQFVVALGILPSLLTGVGLPMDKRSKFLQHLCSSHQDQSLCVTEQYSRLAWVARSMSQLMEHQGMANIIITRHIGDVLAAFLQLSFAPLKPPSTDDVQPEVKPGFVMTQEKHDVYVEEQAQFCAHLRRILDKMYPPLTVKYLLLLQSSGACERVRPAPKSINIKKVATPKWLQLACGKLLTEQLLQNNGVLHVLRGILDLGSSAQEIDTLDPRKYQLIARVIACPPSTGSYSDLETYFQVVCPQILQLLSMDDRSDSKTYRQIAATCVKALSERSIILAKRYLINVIMEPLLRVRQGIDPEDQCKPDVSQEELEQCVQHLHVIFVVGNDPSLVFISHLRPVMLVLLELHCQITFGVSHLRQPVEELIKAFLFKSCLSSALRTIQAFAFNQPVLEDQLQPFDAQQWAFRLGDSAGVHIMRCSGRDQPEPDDSQSTSFYVADDEKAIAIVDLILEAKDKTLAMEFFLNLLKDLTEMMVHSHSPDEQLDAAAQAANVTPGTCDKLLALEKELDETMSQLRKQLMVIRLLGLMSEDDKLRQSLISCKEKTIEFLALTLSRAAALCRSDSSKGQFETSGLEIHSLTTALSLLSFIVTQQNVKPDEWRTLQSLLPDLDVLRKHHRDSSIQQTANKLAQVIATHGAVLDETDLMRQKADDIKRITSEMDKKMHAIKDLMTESYEAALNHVTEEDIATRGHGLIVLTRLVKDKDQQVQQDLERVLAIFQDNLSHPDTYVYLQSINGLVECAVFNSDLVVNKLSEEYAKLDDSLLSPDKAMEKRTKMTEALVRVTRLLGEMTPKHKNQLIQPILSQLNHPDDLIRASLLSNLGEVCKNLRFSLGSIVHEVFDNLHRILLVDKSVEVKRAAVSVISLMLEGLGQDSFMVLETLLKDIWRALLRLQNSEKDDVLLAHVGQAIHQINQIVRRFFQPDPTLTKTIYVLDEAP